MTKEDVIRWLKEEKVGPTVIVEIAEIEQREQRTCSYGELWNMAFQLARSYFRALELPFADKADEIATEVATRVGRDCWLCEWEHIWGGV